MNRKVKKVHVKKVHIDLNNDGENETYKLVIRHIVHFDIKLVFAKKHRVEIIRIYTVSDYVGRQYRFTLVDSYLCSISSVKRLVTLLEKRGY